jgi:hypothetical protein
MKRLLIAMVVALPFAASAATGDLKSSCSMKAGKLTKKAELEKMATVKPAEAKSIAMKAAGGTTISKGGIETEDGCLVYAYHVKTGSGQTEVFVDAGNGTVLKKETEGALRTAAEKPVDKTKELAGRTKEAVTGEPSTNQSAKK